MKELYRFRQFLAEGKLLKEEEIDVLGKEFLQDIQSEMKRMYSMDVDMDDIKDWVQMYYIGYNSEYDEGPGDVDYEGNEFGSEDFESEKKELVFDTGEREDFYTYLEDDLNEDKKGSFRNKFSTGSGSEEYKDFETYYERWEDEWAKPGNAMVFDFDDEDEWGDYKGGKVASHTWEIGYEEEDDHYAPIINNMLNYLEKNKTYSYKNDDGINVKFEIYNPGTIDMEIYYSADDIEKYKNKFN